LLHLPYFSLIFFFLFKLLIEFLLIAPLNLINVTFLLLLPQVSLKFLMISHLFDLLLCILLFFFSFLPQRLLYLQPLRQILLFNLLILSFHDLPYLLPLLRTFLPLLHKLFPSFPHFILILLLLIL